jgi:tRNA-Thr(GGU) m(6)t(6)A37 methyltransferase TsaA
MTDIVLRPIGHVRSPERTPRKGGFKDVVAEIVLEKDLVPGLQGLGKFSHVVIIYFMHIPPDERGAQRMKSLKGHPMGEKGLPEVGVFSLRSPYRPNRIGVTLCELISIEENVIRVKGLDALDGSPVIDMKSPSRSYYSKFPEMRFPDWVFELERIKQAREGHDG